MTAVVEAKTLQERVGARIREQIGDLLTEDDLKKLVETAVREAFFTPQQRRDRYGNLEKDEPPLIVATVREVLVDQVQAATREAMKAHEAEIAKVLEEAIAKGVTKIVAQYVERTILAGPLAAFYNELRTRLQAAGVNLPY